MNHFVDDGGFRLAFTLTIKTEKLPGTRSTKFEDWKVLNSIFSIILTTLPDLLANPLNPSAIPVVDQHPPPVWSPQVIRTPWWYWPIFSVGTSKLAIQLKSLFILVRACRTASLCGKSAWNDHGRTVLISPFGTTFLSYHFTWSISARFLGCLTPGTANRFDISTPVRANFFKSFLL